MNRSSVFRTVSPSCDSVGGFLRRSFFIVLLLVLQLALSAAGQTAATNTQAEAAYTKTIEKRTADIISALSLTNAAAREKVHDIMMAHYRALRDWHDTNDPFLKAAKGENAGQIHASLKQLHDKFLTQISSVLTPEQVDRIKDRMTYNKLKVTFDVYCKNIPNLTEAQKTKVLEFLKEAREEAMDAGSSDEKNKIFRQFKGRINNYLSKEGYDAKQADKEPEKKTGNAPAKP